MGLIPAAFNRVYGFGTVCPPRRRRARTQYLDVARNCDQICGIVSRFRRRPCPTDISCHQTDLSAGRSHAQVHAGRHMWQGVSLIGERALAWGVRECVFRYRTVPSARGPTSCDSTSLLRGHAGRLKGNHFGAAGIPCLIRCGNRTVRWHRPQRIREALVCAFEYFSRVLCQSHVSIHSHIELNQIACVEDATLLIHRLAAESQVSVILTPDHGLPILLIAPKYYAKHPK